LRDGGRDLVREGGRVGLLRRAAVDVHLAVHDEGGRRRAGGGHGDHFVRDRRRRRGLHREKGRRGTGKVEVHKVNMRKQRSRRERGRGTYRGDLRGGALAVGQAVRDGLGQLLVGELVLVVVEVRRRQVDQAVRDPA